MINIALYGRKIGYALIALVSTWDVLLTGVRGFYEYSIGYKGIVLIWVALGLIVLSFKAEKDCGGR